MDTSLDRRNKIYDALCHQIEREDGLISTRVGWMLTFEGLLFGALALLGGKPENDASVYWALRYTLPAVGIAVGVLALFAVRAALSALEQLKSLWDPNKFAQLPKPFGDTHLHRPAATYALGLPILMIGAWTVIGLIFVVHDVCHLTGVR